MDEAGEDFCIVCKRDQHGCDPDDASPDGNRTGTRNWEECLQTPAQTQRHGPRSEDEETR